MHTDGNPNYGVVPSPDTEAYPDDVLPALRADAELTHTITIRTCAGGRRHPRRKARRSSGDSTPIVLNYQS